MSIRFLRHELPVGTVLLKEEDGFITALRLGKEAEDFSGETGNSSLLKEALRQLEEYCAGKLRIFDLPLALNGTPFQMRVWNVLRSIPWGETLSYGEVAERAGSPGGARAAGMACHVNPVAIVIPCHRVIGANGALTGFGCGMEYKIRLLRLEKIL